MGILLLSFFLLLLISASLSGSESALFSLSQGRRENMKRNARGDKLHRVLTIIRWMKKPEKTLTAILLGNLAVNMAISEVGNRIIEYSLVDWDVNTSLISLVAITLLLLIFGEILPKTVALSFAESWSIAAEPLLNFWMKISAPIAKPVYAFAEFVTSYFPSVRGNFNEEELRQAVTLAEEQGLLNEAERKRLQRSISFYHDTTYSAMIPRSRVFMLAHNLSPNKAKKAFLENKKSSALVYHSKDGRIIGALHVRNLLPAVFHRQKSFRNRIQDVLFLPETLSLRESLIAFTKRGDEVAAILDESGEFVGLLTLKDLLRRIMGDWPTYSNADARNSETVETLADNIFRVKGAIILDDFNDVFQTSLTSDYAETLSGFLLEQLDDFPHPSSVFQFQNMEFYDMKIKNNRIDSVTIRKTQK